MLKFGKGIGGKMDKETYLKNPFSKRISPIVKSGAYTLRRLLRNDHAFSFRKRLHIFQDR